MQDLTNCKKYNKTKQIFLKCGIKFDILPPVPKNEKILYNIYAINRDAAKAGLQVKNVIK